MSAFLAIVKLTFKAVIRSHIFQLLLLLLLVTIIVLPVTIRGDGTALAQIQISLKYCLGTVGFILSISSIWLGCFTMGRDVETYQIHMIITKPVSRVLVWLAKFTGIMILNTILLSISALLVFILVFCQFQDPVFFQYIKWPLIILIVASGLTIAIIKFIWFNRYILKFFRLKLIKSDDKKHRLTSLLSVTWLISFLVLIVSSATLYALHNQFRKETFSLEDKIKIQNEVLVGRRVFMPIKPDIEKAALREYERRLNQISKKYGDIPEERKQEALFEIRKQMTASLGEVRARTKRYWFYEGLNHETKSPLFIRYRPYIGKVSTKKQRQTMGSWAYGAFISDGTDAAKPGETKQLKFFYNPTSRRADKMMGGIFNELRIPSYQKSSGGKEVFTISPDGRTALGFANLDPQNKTIFFQAADGPQLLMKVTGFLTNYLKAIIIIFFKLVFVTGLSCAVGGFVSTPVAIFSIVSYLFFGSVSTYLLGYEDRMEIEYGPGPNLPFLEQIGSNITKVLGVFIIPMQNFEVSQLLSGGELIEWSYLTGILFFNVFLRGIPVVLFGIWLFKRREMGLVIKK